MKEKLSDNGNRVCVQMDFAENYNIKEIEEVQSVYFNAEMVSQHSVFIFYKSDDEVHTHKSFVVLSVILEHNATMVLAIVEKVMVKVKELCQTLLLMIRGNTIKYSSFKKKQQQQQEIQLEQEIKIIEDEVNANFINMSGEILDNLETKKTMLYDIQKDKIEGMVLRSRSRYEDLGEKPTQYFFLI